MKNLNLGLILLSGVISCVESTKHGHEIKCPGSYNCTCIDGTTPIDHKIYCPNQEERVIAVFTYPVGTEVTCFSKTQNKDYNLLKGLKLGSKKWITILECPLPSMSFGELIQNLDVKDLKSFTFRSDKNLGDSFVKKRLTGLENVPSLYFSRNGLTDIPDDWFQGLYKLNILDLSENNLHLRKNNFASAANLEELDLSHNNLAHLEEGVFSNLEKLKYLSLDTNKLTILSRGVFSDLVNLEILNIRYNPLQKLPADVFQDLTQLVNIKINLTKVSQIPEGLFSNNINLKDIEVEIVGRSGINIDLEVNMPNYFMCDIFKARESPNECKYKEEFYRDFDLIISKLFHGNPMTNECQNRFRREMQLVYIVLQHLCIYILLIIFH